MAEVHLPATLPPLFEGLPRQLDLDAASVGEAIGQLDARWPGLRDRVCDSAGGGALRPHIHVFVDGERAELDTPLAAGARVDVIAAISGGRRQAWCTVARHGDLTSCAVRHTGVSLCGESHTWRIGTPTFNCEASLRYISNRSR